MFSTLSFFCKKQKTPRRKAECFQLLSIAHKLVGNIGKQSHSSCSLDSDSKISLMLSASAGHSLGENLCTFRNILAKSSGFLVIDFSEIFNAELANLFLLAVYVVLTESGLCSGSCLCSRSYSSGNFSFFHILNLILSNIKKLLRRADRRRSTFLRNEARLHRMQIRESGSCRGYNRPSWDLHPWNQQNSPRLPPLR